MAWKRGQWLAVCDRCGFEFLSGQLQKTWDGLMVDKACFETRHPQEFVRAVREQLPPWTRPEPAEVEVDLELDYVVEDYYEMTGSFPEYPGGGEYTTQHGT